MNGDITLEALRQCQRASKVMSPFIIFAVFDVSCLKTKKNTACREQCNAL